MTRMIVREAPYGTDNDLNAFSDFDRLKLVAIIRDDGTRIVRRLLCCDRFERMVSVEEFDALANNFFMQSATPQEIWI